MVNAGPFLLVRFSALIIHSPMAMTVIAIVGGTTALFAAVVSLTQTDIKKILAYSTISQIGFMIMTCGVGAFAAAIFHMLAHGCLKGFLFLSTGNQLESVAAHDHNESASGRSRPSWFLYVGALILACVPPFVIFSGSYERLWTVHHSGADKIAFWVIGLLTVFFTAMYLFRGVTSLFQRSSSAVVQPRFFSPLHVIAISVGALGLIGLLMALWSWFAPFLTPALGPYPLAADAGQAGSFSVLLILPLLAAFAGWALAFMLSTNAKPSFVARSAWAKTMYVLFLNKFYFDEIYSVFIVQPTIRFSRWLWRIIDVRVIDRAVVQSAHQTVGLARWLWEFIDVRQIEKNAERIGRAAAATGHRLQDIEPRTLQHHLLVFNCWLVLAIVFFYWFVLS
jgi:NADH-quinone oxidoreductase subunit L